MELKKMNVDNYRKEFFAEKDGAYEIINIIEVFKKYKISKIKNPIEPVTNIQVKNYEKFEEERELSDRTYKLEKGDRIIITENIYHTIAENVYENEVDLCQIIWKDGKQFDDFSNYYCRTIFRGEKNIANFIPADLPQVTLTSEMLTKVDLQVSDTYKGTIILKIENVPIKVKHGSL